MRREIIGESGKAAFGTLLVPCLNSRSKGRIIVRLGEKLSTKGRIDREPPGSVRYIRIKQKTGELGFSKVLIQPQLVALRRVSGTVPTIRGPVQIAIENDGVHF